MVPLPLALSSLAVRWAHVVGMAVALGGATFVWFLLRETDGDTALSSTALTAATGYERLFWAAMGLLVMTGVGNLGSLAPGIPGGEWSATLTAKLLLVAAVVLGSLVRSLLVVEARRERAETVAADSLRRSYAATTLALAAVVVLAEVLAHG
ncbi:Copper resistance protein D [Halogranum gelatinilyticum]|uniref:Copper resistance protein D n=1 Tax=Halogranum gelatinilyticum TaxID=660521 RepID=A0A1G9PIV3_9EURY|nr:CopD family protein [Halogranum gelatinilyticum]SDL98782.1 Copper resistance protein D [Halogranum gelatinilyticum]